MDLIENLHTEIVQDEELEKIRELKGVEEEI